jgi:hypothetical protein
VPTFVIIEDLDDVLAVRGCSRPREAAAKAPGGALIAVPVIVGKPATKRGRLIEAPVTQVAGVFSFRSSPVVNPRHVTEAGAGRCMPSELSPHRLVWQKGSGRLRVTGVPVDRSAGFIIWVESLTPGVTHNIYGSWPIKRLLG